jgi:Kef-type K+ transport system membrane component KefB
LTSLFVEISIVIVVAAIVAGIMKLLKQPLIVGHLITGIIVSPHVLNIIDGTTITVLSLAEIGIALLLFMIGLHLSPGTLKQFGKICAITGLGQIIFTFITGFILALLFGFSIIAAIYIAVALTFSSTIIIMKLLSDKKETEMLHGKIALGFLVVQDVVAALILLLLSAWIATGNIETLLFDTLWKITLVSIAIVILTRGLLPRIIKFVASNQELLLFFCSAWALLIASIFYSFNFSIEIGALIAGFSLSSTPYRNAITSRIKGLRDFFLLMFFVVLGSMMTFDSIMQNLIPVIIFSALVLIGNPIIVMFLMGIHGYSKRIGFLSGLRVAQISEFSLIITALGVRAGHVSAEILSVVTLIAIITISLSSYVIMNSAGFYKKLAPYLSIFERKVTAEKSFKKQKAYTAFLFGYGSLGSKIAKELKKEQKNFIVIDDDPEIIERLSKTNIPYLYGDASDREFLKDIELMNMKMVISTLPDKETNSLLIETYREEKPKSIIVATAHSKEDADYLYKSGADYVMIPDDITGDKMMELLKKNDYKRERYASLGIKKQKKSKKK